MSNPFGAPEITVEELNELLTAEEEIIIVDVREMSEIDRVSLKCDFIEAPLSDIESMGEDGIPYELQEMEKDARIAVFCHHGMRSARVTNYLIELGWENTLSVAGGVDEWAKKIDPSIGTY